MGYNMIKNWEKSMKKQLFLHRFYCKKVDDDSSIESGQILSDRWNSAWRDAEWCERQLAFSAELRTNDKNDYIAQFEYEREGKDGRFERKG